MQDETPKSVESVPLPEWKVVVGEFLSAGFDEGELISHAWWRERLRKAYRHKSGPAVDADYRVHMSRIKEHLLFEHRIYLKSLYDRGYVWTRTEEQSETVFKKWIKAQRALGNRIIDGLQNIKRDKLTDEQKRLNDAHLSKVTCIRGMFTRRQLRQMSDEVKQIADGSVETGPK